MKFKSFSLFLAAALLASCVKTPQETGEYQPALGDVRIQVTLPALTKAGLAGDSCVWEAGDSISVWDGYGARVFRTTGGGSATAEFTGKAADAAKYYVVYPAGACHSYADGKADVKISGEQQARLSSLSKESFACCGVATDGRAELKASAAVLSVELKPGNKAVSGIVIKGSGNTVLSGYMVITSEPDGVKPVYVGESNTVKLVPADGEMFIKPGTYNVTVTPTALQDGLDITFENEFYESSTLHAEGLPAAVTAGESASTGAFDPVGALLDETFDESADPASTKGFNFGSLMTRRHPRLIADAEDFVRVRKFIADPANASTPLVKLHNDAVGYADVLAEKTDAVEPGDASEALSRLLACSYAYITDGAAKYLSAAQSNLSAVCGLADWCPEDCAVNAQFQMAVAAAYDWLYYELTEDERTAARTALQTKGLAARPAEAVKGSAGQVCNAGVLCSALVLYEKSKALSAGAIDWSVDASLPSLDALYGNDGAYPEGYDAWNIGTSCQVAMTQALMVALDGAAGIENHAGFAKTPGFMLYMSDGVGPFAYADGGSVKVSTLPAMWWFAARQCRPEFVYCESALLERNSYRNSSAFLPLLPLYLIEYPGVDLRSPSAPQSPLWSGNSAVPMVAVRNGWTGNEKDVYFAVKGGKAGENGAHMDAGSFVFDADGVRWIDEIVPSDLKVYEEKIAAEGKDFRSVAQDSWRWDVFVMSSLAHPTMSFANAVSGRLHDTDHSVSGKAVLVSVVDNEHEKGGVFNLSPVYEGQVESATRTVVLKDGDSVVVTDEITALPSAAANLVWTAPTRATASIDEDCIELVSGRSDMYIVTTSSEEDVVPVYCDFGVTRPAGKWGWIARDWDQTVSFRSIVGFQATVPAGRSVRFVTVISRVAPGQESGGAGNERPEM